MVLKSTDLKQIAKLLQFGNLSVLMRSRLFRLKIKLSRFNRPRSLTQYVPCAIVWLKQGMIRIKSLALERFRLNLNKFPYDFL